MVHVTLDNGQLKLIGDFDLKRSPLYYDPKTDSSPYFNISFAFSPEAPLSADNDELIELLAEKLKQNFIKLGKGGFKYELEDQAEQYYNQNK